MSTPPPPPPPPDLAEARSRALGWLRSQMEPLPVGPLGITPDAAYGYDHLGPIAGSFTPPDGRPTLPGHPLRVLSPYPIPQGHAGPIAGTLEGVPAGRYRVDGYLYTDAEYYQSSSAVVEHPGSGASAWSLDAFGFAGEWRLKLVNADSGAQVGATWVTNVPPSYVGLELRYWLATDALYLQAVAPAYTTHRWEFSKDHPGWAVVELAEPGGAVLGRWAPRTGRVRSYRLAPGDEGFGTPFEHRCYAYDQALCVLAFLREGDLGRAVEVARGLAQAQLPSGAWPFSFGQVALQADPYLRTGANAWAVHALAELLRAAPDPSLEQSLRAGLGYLASLQHPQLGLLRGGSGRYLADGSFDAGYTVPWFSTEHNLDAFFAFTSAQAALGEAEWGQRAGAVLEGMLSHLWDEEGGRFWQGLLDEGGTPDGAGALDCHSWGALLLAAAGRWDQARRALSRVNLHYRVEGLGYKPYAPEEGYPGALPTLWLEGSFGVALALLRLGHVGAAVTLLRAYLPLQAADGSFRYALRRDAALQVADLPAVASTAWCVLATGGALGAPVMDDGVLALALGNLDADYYRAAWGAGAAEGGGPPWLRNREAFEAWALQRLRGRWGWGR